MFIFLEFGEYTYDKKKKTAPDRMKPSLFLRFFVFACIGAGISASFFTPPLADNIVAETIAGI